VIGVVSYLEIAQKTVAGFPLMAVSSSNVTNVYKLNTEPGPEAWP